MNEPKPAEAAQLHSQSDPQWYKDAVIYQLHVKAFYDGNNNGIGDFAGLMQKLDYVQALGVNTIWLLPFYVSPLKDDGYDIADYQQVHPDYGTVEDFKAFIAEAHLRNLRVITELVINHTSDQHPWFQAARRAPPGSPEREFYVWSSSDRKFADTRIIFTDTEKSNWTWDPVAGAYYWHRFFSHQPDLNHNNPAVVEAVIGVMKFWFDMGVDGMRLDAVPYLCVREGTSNENLPETHAVLKRMRAALDASYPDRCFLAEANQWPEDVHEYFGDGDECHMAYHFPLMPRMYMALAQEDRHPIIEIMEQTPDIPDSCQWAIFLRNHDELTLEMVTDRERDYMYRTYATHPRMKLNVGIMRRLAPLLDNSRDRIELMNSLLLSLPGTPIIYYGDELGMGDNIFLGDRDGVRTPMQWSPDRNGGFSLADPGQLYLPAIMSSVYGYQAINVEAQDRSPDSLLQWMRRLIGVRHAHPAFGRGQIEFLHPRNRKILAYLRSSDDEILLCVANLSRHPQPALLDLAEYAGRVPLELLGQTPFPAIDESNYVLALPGFGFYWFRLTSDSGAHATSADGEVDATRMPVLVWSDGWRTLTSDDSGGAGRAIASRERRRFVETILRPWLAVQRWYGGAADDATLRLASLTEYAGAADRWQWLLLDCSSSDGSQEYLLPLVVGWEDEADPNAAEEPATARRLCRIRHQARPGHLGDAAGDPRFIRALLERAAATAGDDAATAADGLRVSVTDAFTAEQRTDAVTAAIATPDDPGSNTTIEIGDWGFLKLYRRVSTGASIEREMSEFLTAVGFRRVPRVLAGFAMPHPVTGETIELALLQEKIAHQGTGWDLALLACTRFLETVTTVDDAASEQSAYLVRMMNLLGKRTAELHGALLTVTGDPAFDPQPLSEGFLAAWLDGLAAETTSTFERLEQTRGALPQTDRANAAALLHRERAIVEGLRRAALTVDSGRRCRYHGDLHLAQVLLVEEDFAFIDFEGEPLRAAEERRARHTPLKDVAGMIRSFDYVSVAAAREAARSSAASPLALTLLAAHLRESASQAFLSGYQSRQVPAAGMAGAAGEGAGRDAAVTADPLLRLLLWEKALYELRYEIALRPEWIATPLHALVRYAGSIERTS